MTGRISNHITFGGVKFDGNHIKSKKTVVENGITYFVVQFHDDCGGQSVKYPKQASRNQASCDADLRKTEYKNISGATITGSQDTDIISLSSCNNTFVDVANDKKGDLIFVKNKGGFKTKNVSVKLSPYKNESGDKICVGRDFKHFVNQYDRPAVHKIDSLY